MYTSDKKNEQIKEHVDDTPLSHNCNPFADRQFLRPYNYNPN